MFKNIQECDQDETCHGLRQEVKNKHRCFRNENVEFYLVKKCHFQVTIKIKICTSFLHSFRSVKNSLRRLFPLLSLWVTWPTFMLNATLVVSRWQHRA